MEKIQHIRQTDSNIDKEFELKAKFAYRMQNNLFSVSQLLSEDFQSE
jgi:hypothetical protein